MKKILRNFKASIFFETDFNFNILRFLGLFLLLTLANFAAAQENSITFGVSYESALEVTLANISDDESPLRIEKTQDFDENKITILSYRELYPVDSK